MRRSFLVLLVGVICCAYLPTPANAQLWRTSKKKTKVAVSSEKPTLGKGLKTTVKLPSVTGSRWALLIGINKYATLSELKYCAQDAKAIRDVLVRYGGYDPQKIILLTDDQDSPAHRPTFLNMKRRIGQVTREAGPNDSLLIAFSGHGTVVNNRGYLVPQDGDEDASIAMKDIKDQIEACEARQKVLILDACHSGKDRSSPRLGDSLLNEAAGKGFITITSCDAEEKAYEDDAAQRGIFTKHLVNGLSGKADSNRDGDITHGELYEYIYEKVRAWSIQNGKEQHPKLIGEQMGKIVLAKVTAGVMPTGEPGNGPHPVARGGNVFVQAEQIGVLITQGGGAVNAGTLEARIVQMIKNNMFADASELLNGRTEQEWKTAVHNIDTLVVCWNKMMKSQKRTTIHATRIRNAVNALAMDHCLWYDKTAPWYAPSHEALEKILETMTDGLDSGTKKDDWNVFLMLAMQWRDLSRLLAKQTEVDIADIQNGRIRSEGASHMKKRSWMNSLTPLPDHASGLPTKMSLKTPFPALSKLRFIYIPPGKSVIGPAHPDEKDRIVAELSGYYIAESEISNDMYLLFCREWEIPVPEHLTRKNNPFCELQQPVVSVSYNEAVQFCRWLEDVLSELDSEVKCRLPTESEIDRSSRGPSLYRYPWGYEYDPKSCFNALTSPSVSRKITDASSDVSFYGVVNLAGNVSEWSQDSWSSTLSRSVPDGSKDPAYKTDDGFKTIKGGNYTSDQEASMRTAQRQASGTEQQERTVGFRVVLRVKTAKNR
jgi:formylglycine-generating enzyme required for sulfatase activity